MAEKVFYVLSNGGGSSYPDNTLTYFKNKLPAPLEIDRRYEIGIQAFGFSSVFKNIITPKDKAIPSLIITDCHLLDRIQRPCVMNGILGCENTVNFDFMSRALECLYENGEQKCVLNMSIHKRQCDSEGYCEDENTRFTTKPEANQPQPSSRYCNYWYYYIDSNKKFGLKELNDLQSQIKRDTNVELKYENNRLTFDLNDREAYIHFRFKWVMMHPTFIQSFNFRRLLFFKKYEQNQSVPGMPYQVEFEGGEQRIERSVNYKGHLFRVYLIAKRSLKQRNFVKHIIRSRPFDLDRPLYPKYVKISSDQIVPQILNNTYSNDLLVFSPEFTDKEKYMYREIEAVDFIPLLNSTISDFRIKLVDENNEQLNLAEGHATVIKLIIKEMASNKQSFNVRLTSSPSADYPENTSSKFKVQLPTSLQLGEDWRVSINSISHSTVFATFLRDTNTRTISFKDSDNQLYQTTFSSRYHYSMDEIVSTLNNFMQTNTLGNCTFLDGYIHLNFTKLGRLAISNLAAKVLGFNGKNVQGNQFFNCSDTTSPNFKNGQYILKPENKPDLSYLHPNYMLIYSNIVKSTIVGGEYAKILRIAPLVNTDLDYAITEFRNKERYELDLREVRTIEIMLCSHDGEPIDFVTTQDVIINLEFSNYTE